MHILRAIKNPRRFACCHTNNFPSKQPQGIVDPKHYPDGSDYNHQTLGELFYDTTYDLFDYISI